MRRPHRTLPQRLRMAAVAYGRALPPAPRRALRKLANRPIDRGVRHLPAETVEEFDAWQVQDVIATKICDVLTAAQIEVVRLSRSGWEWLAVDLAQRGAAIAALQHSTTCAAWLVENPTGGRPRLIADLSPDTTAAELSVFRHLRSPEGHYLCGREVPVQLQFWDAAGGHTPRGDGGTFDRGTRLPPSRNKVAPYLVPSLWAAAQERTDRRLPEPKPSLLEMLEPIDAVYTWVDDRDPLWRQRRAAVQPGTTGLAADALDPARTRDRDELRYSLRSLGMYANWIRRVWIVTDGQVPAWLDLDNPRVSIVTHAEIFSDPDALPVFNSHAIESQIHHIDGLAEHFLYLNDDFFFGRPVRPELFFHGNGMPKTMLSPITIDLDLDTDARNGAMLAARKGRELMEGSFGRTVTHRMQHVPHAHRKSILSEFEASIPSDFDRIAHSRFRHRDDLSIPSDLGHYYAYATGRTVTASLSFQYVDFDSPFANEYLQALLAQRSADAFCVNDVGGRSDSSDARELSDFFDGYFPIRGPFERAGS